MTSTSKLSPNHIVPITLFLILCTFNYTFAGSKPDIISYDAKLLENAVSINVKWQSSEPVILVNASVGKKEKKSKSNPMTMLETLMAIRVKHLLFCL